MWKYQTTEHDCWLCALQNTLYASGYNIPENRILNILKKENLLLFEGRAFFPYFAVILEHLKIHCDFVLNSHNPLLETIIDRKQKVFLPNMLEDAIQHTLRKESISYYFYYALKRAFLSPYVTIHLDTPSPQQYLNKENVLLACLPVSSLYHIKEEGALHAVTIYMAHEKLNMIDPYSIFGANSETGWEDFQQASWQFQWLDKIPYYIAISPCLHSKDKAISSSGTSLH